MPLQEGALTATLLTPLGVAFVFGAILLFGPPILGLYCSLHAFKYRWIEIPAKAVADRAVRFQERIVDLLSRAFTFLIMLNGALAIPHLFQIWMTTASELDHASAVLLATAIGVFIAYKYPDINQNLLRLRRLQSKPRSQFSEEELSEVDQIENSLDKLWGTIKTAIFLNGLVFWNYGLQALGIR
jgi:hypothetical protein